MFEEPRDFLCSFLESVTESSLIIWFSLCAWKLNFFFFPKGQFRKPIFCHWPNKQRYHRISQRRLTKSCFIFTSNWRNLKAFTNKPHYLLFTTNLFLEQNMRHKLYILHETNSEKNGERKGILD